MCYYGYLQRSVFVMFCMWRELYTGEILSLEHIVLRNNNNPVHHEFLWYEVCFNAFQIQNHLFQIAQGLYFLYHPLPDLKQSLPETLSFCSMAISSTFGTKQHNPAQILKDSTIHRLFLNSQFNFKSLMMSSTQTNTAPQALLFWGKLYFFHIQSKKFHEF